MFWKDENSPTNQKKEEISCDKFVFDLSLADISTYSARTNEEERLVLGQKAASLVLVMSLTLAVADQDYWSETQSHPSIQQHLKALTAHLSGLPSDDPAWLYHAAVLLARISFAGIGQMQILAASPRKLFEQLLTKL